jgi:hypothetical protein
VTLQERLTTTISEFQELVELFAKYDWDFDTYLEEDVPAAVSSTNSLFFVSDQTRPCYAFRRFYLLVDMLEFR